MAKVEVGIVWLFSFLTLITKSDVMFVASVVASVTVTLRNLPGACQIVLNILYNLKERINKNR